MVVVVVGVGWQMGCVGFTPLGPHLSPNYSTRSRPNLSVKSAFERQRAVLRFNLHVTISETKYVDVYDLGYC